MGRSVPVLCTLLLASVLASACSGGAEQDAPWLEMLAHFPDTTEARGRVIMNDYAGLRSLLGVERPASDAGEEALRSYVESLIAIDGDFLEGRTGIISANMLGLERLPPTLLAMRSEIGVSFPDVDQDADAGSFSRPLQLLRGAFDAASIRAAVESDPVFSEILERGSHGGLEFYSWGNDGELDPFHQSAFRPDGESARLVPNGEYVYWADWTEGVESMIDAAAGERRSLADTDDFRRMADALARFDLYTTAFSAPEGTVFDQSDEQLALLHCSLACTDDGYRSNLELLDGETHLEPYEAIATGAGLDGEGVFLVVIIAHEDAAAAEENLPLFEQRVAEAVSFEDPTEAIPVTDAEIRADGPLIIGTFRTDEPDLWSTLIFPGTYHIFLHD